MKINGYIDHTLLKASATEEEVRQLCGEAVAWRFAAVCVNPCFASLVSSELAGSGVKTCVVIGFPLGATFTSVKVCEAVEAVANGAQEVDMVMNIGALKDGRHDIVLNDIGAVVAGVSGRASVKVIIECCLLTRDEIVKSCELALEGGAQYVKTSTGFAAAGAQVQDVKLMRETVGQEAGVKASGGIRTYEDAMAMIEAGATRLGTSAGVSIVTHL